MPTTFTQSCYALQLGLILCTARCYAGDSIEYGTYVCVVQRSVGIQGDGADRRQGRIKLPDEQEKFVMKIEGLGKPEGLERVACANAPAKRERMSPPERYRTSGYDLWWSCDTTVKLTFSKGKSARELRADRLRGMDSIFRENLAGFLTFNPATMRYSYSYFEFPMNFYLEEGVCEKK
jgi:hypothetical protein